MISKHKKIERKQISKKIERFFFKKLDFKENDSNNKHSSVNSINKNPVKYIPFWKTTPMRKVQKSEI